MGFDLDKIDNPTEKQTSAPVAKKGFDLDKVEAGGTDSYLLPGANTGLDPKDFSFQLKVNANNKKLRAQNQTWYKQAGLAIGNAVANTGTGLIE